MKAFGYFIKIYIILVSIIGLIIGAILTSPIWIFELLTKKHI